MQIDQATLGQRLKDARINCGLNQEEVARELGIPRTAIVHIEGGNRAVSTLELAEMAKLFRRTIADFFRDAPAGEEDVLTALGRISYEFQDDPKVQQEIESHVNLCQHGASLRAMLDIDALSAPPEYPLASPSSTWDAVQQGQSIALAERRRLSVGDNPIPDMADLISAEGIWASGTRLPDEISGMFLRHSSIGMVILTNYTHRRARKRFSYAHEYAHALMDRSASVTVSRVAERDQLTEVRANAFAAAFLMPGGGISAFLAHWNKCTGTRESIAVYDPSIGQSGAVVRALRRSTAGSQRINYQLVAQMAYHFGVSYQSACYRLKALKCVKDGELAELLTKHDMAMRFLEVLKIKDAIEGTDEEGQTKPDRELRVELSGLAVEAYNRELISKAKLIELGSLVQIDRKDMLDLART